MAYNTTTPKKMMNFGDAMEGTVGTKAARVTGENGSDMYSQHGVAGTAHPAVGACVALFSGIVDTSSPEACEEFVEGVFDTVMHRSDLSNKQKANFMADLIVAAYHCRDIRNNGKGRRDQSRAMQLKLMSYFPKVMLELLPDWKEYGYWKDYNKLLELFAGGQSYKGMRMSKVVEKIYEIYVEQLKADRASLDEWEHKKQEAKRLGVAFNEKCEVSLAAKFFPKEGRSLDKKLKVTKQFAKRMFPELFRTDFRTAMKQLRRFYSPLQDAINTTEKLMCAQEFDKIRFQFVPGKCLFRGKKAFLYEKKRGGELRGDDPKRLKCRENLMTHLQAAIDGKGAKVHGKTVYIHNMCSQVYENWASLTEGDKLTLEAQWLSHVRHFEELIAKGDEEGTQCALDNMLVLADFSGSMQGDPMAGAMAITLLVATLSKGAFASKFISFESNPRWISLKYPKTREAFNQMMSGGASRNGLGVYGYGSQQNPLGTWDATRAGGKLTFVEMCAVCYTSPWGGNTDFLAAHDLILDVCVTHGCEAPKKLVIASDMQFDQANQSGFSTYRTLTSLVGKRQYKPAYGNASYRYSSYTEKSLPWQDHHEILKEAYLKAGKEMPEMIYWNLRSTNTFVTTADQTGVQMLGGFSTNQLKLFLEEMELDPEASKAPAVTPWDTFQKAVTHECYLPIRKRLEELGKELPKSIFAHYVAPLSQEEQEALDGGEVECHRESKSSSSELATATSSTATSSMETPTKTTATVSLTETTPPPAPKKAKATTSTPMEQLQGAKRMLDAGLIKEADYDRIKEKVLDMMTS